MKFEYQRKQMVESQLRANLVIDESILDSFSKVKLENFLSDNLKSHNQHYDKDYPFFLLPASS